MAFLTPFPNTEGFTVVIPKQHHESYLFGVDAETMHALVEASREVAQKIDRAFDDVGRTGLIFEGFGVNHLHAKLFPMHGTAHDEWRQHASEIDTYFEMYPGYISSHDSARADDETLARTAKKISEA